MNACMNFCRVIVWIFVCVYLCMCFCVCVCVLCMCLCRQLCMCLGCVFDVCSVYISILFEQGVWFNCFHVCLCMYVFLSPSQPVSQPVSQSVSQSFSLYEHLQSFTRIHPGKSLLQHANVHVYVYICIHMQFIQFVFDCCV